jgi:hypothetical protein
MLDRWSLLGNVAALWLGWIAFATLYTVAQHAAWSHQAAHAALEAFR